ncbi:Uncharacterised protein [BD1-7 clade bacterium]|uniref:Uncharacterized protein n=1 Tax=BD1-7 clade bacterium TaxID=2029982 RepID=A0A5S9PPK7_9GAMM|nr:Uncharacterised protein [BD1-7 clade bacterium]
MSVLNVQMGQAIWTDARIDQDQLITGAGMPSDSLSSCAAIFMANLGTNNAGLYHYPAGNIDITEVCDLISEMGRVIAPTETYIVYGTFNMMSFFGSGSGGGGDSIVPSDRYSFDLRDYVLRAIPDSTRLRRIPTQTGIACFSMPYNRVCIEYTCPINDLTDLRHHPRGQYGRYTIAWAGDN